MLPITTLDCRFRIAGRKSFLGGVGGDLGIAETIQAARSTHPETAFAIFKQRQNPIVGEALGEAEGRDLVSRDSHEPRSIRPNPQVVLAILKDLIHAAVRRLSCNLAQNSAIARDAIQTGRGPHPERVLVILEKRGNAAVFSQLQCDGKLAIAIAVQIVGRANPESAILLFKKSADPCCPTLDQVDAVFGRSIQKIIRAHKNLVPLLS